MFKLWVIDASAPAPKGAVCFVPYEPPDTIVFGMNYISDESPGELVGIIHNDGQEAAEQWEKDNPDWHIRYGPASRRRKG